MTPDIRAAVERHGLTPPPDGSHRTTCPKCSHTRQKKWARCLKISPTQGGWVELYCFHCGWVDVA